MMECVRIRPKKLNGEISVPSSKSMCHRAIIAAALSDGESKIGNVIFSDDINATIDAMRTLGASIQKTGDDSLKIKGGFPKALNDINIDCKESGSTLRFLIPIALVAHTKVMFTGRGKLVSRPLDTYYRIFKEQKIKYSTKDGELPLKIDGQLLAGIYEVEGNISSQFITGLLYALPMLNGDSKIVIINDLESKAYVDLTLDILSKFGVHVINNDYKEFIIKGKQNYSSRDYIVEGDFSQAAFWLVGGILGEEIHSLNIDMDSLQGDKIILDLIKGMYGDIQIDKFDAKTKSSRVKGITIDASQCPDIVPILTVLASIGVGESKIINAARLRIKESDRLKAISTELNKLGADVVELEDGLIINGTSNLKGGVVSSWNDHRIAMALAIASIKCTEEVIITNSDCVNKSYPHFWEDFKALGGDIDEFNMGE